DLNHSDLGACVRHRAGDPIVAETKGVHLAILGSLHSQSREHLSFGAAGSLRLGNRLEDFVRHAFNFDRHGPSTHEPSPGSPPICGEGEREAWLTRHLGPHFVATRDRPTPWPGSMAPPMAPLDG